MRSRLISRSLRSMSSRICVVSPSLRRPSSRSACLTQFRMVCSVGSNSRASEPGLRPLRTNSMICSLYSGGYRPCCSLPRLTSSLWLPQPAIEPTMIKVSVIP